MGGKKPVGDHPSRGSYFRRIHTTRGGHHGGSTELQQGHGEIGVEGGDREVPVYQEFSLFSAFSSSDRFGGLLETNNTSHSDNRNSLTSDTISNEFHDLHNSSNLVIGTYKEDDKVVETGPPTTAQYSALLEKNEQLEIAFQRLQDTVCDMSQAMDRLNYEHSLIVQQLQQSWQFIHMHLCYPGEKSYPNIHSTEGSLPTTPCASGPLAYTTEEDMSLTQTTGEQPNRETALVEITEDIRKLKERVCTVEGRHKMVQGKVSQLDKLYGTTSASWGRHIKEILQQNASNAISHKESSSCCGETSSRNQCNADYKSTERHCDDIEFTKGTADDCAI